MNVFNYLFAKALRYSIVTAIAAVTIGFLIPTAASAQGINCIPSSWYANYNGCGGITNVTLGSLNNSTGNCATNGGNNDYTSSGFSEPVVIATIPASLSVSINQDWQYGAGFLYVYIDINRDGVFQWTSTETVYSNTNIPGGTSTQNIPINLPASAGTGRTRMRIKWGGYTGYNSPPDPCSGPAMGEWEDYIINITPPFPDPSPVGLVLTTPGGSTGQSAPIPAGQYDVGFTLKNISGSSLTSVVVNYSFNGPTSGSGSFTWATGPLASGASVLVKLPLLAGVDLADALNPYNVTVTISGAIGSQGAGDSNPNNNTLVASVAPALLGGTPANPKVYYVGGTVVPGAWFPNLTNVGSALTFGGLLGAIEFRIRPGTYNDQMLLGQLSTFVPNGFPGASNQTPILFGPDAAAGGNVSNVIISSANSVGNNNYAAQINASDNITFQNLTFTVNSATAGRIFWLRNGNQNIRIQNCVLNGRTVAASTPTTITEDALIYSEPANTMADLTITNNTFNAGDYAMNLDGGGSGPVVSGVVITSNKINDFFTRGISIQRYTVPLIQKNTITSNSANISPIYGIYLNLIQNSATVLQNTINIPRSGFGINFNSNTSVTGSTTLIANNMINIGNATVNTYGIYASSFNTVNIFQNTINVNTLSSSLASALYLISPGANTRIVNNIIYNRGAGYAYYHSNTAYPTESNYNNIYSAGSFIGYTGGTSQATLASFRSATAKDANSVSKTVTFAGPISTYLGAMDPQLRGSNSYNNTSVGNTNVDFNDVIRRVPPYMGAHELIPVANFVGGAIDSGCAGRTSVLSPTVSFTSMYPTPFTLPVLPSNVRYQWTKGGIPIFDDGVRIFGTSTSTLTILNTNTFDEDNYALNAIIKDGAAEFTFVDTLTYQYSVFLRVNEPVIISTPPLSQVACRGGSVVLSVIATKGRIWGYQWQRDGVNLTNGFNQFNADEVRGANAVSLTLTNVQYGASGNYRAIIATSCGKNFDTSATAVVYVAKPTQILTPPASQVAQEAGSVRFEVNVAEATIGFNNNLTPVQYQWLKGGVVLNDNTRISGATTSVLTIRNLTPADAASNYKVRVIGACGGDSTLTFSLSVAKLTIPAIAAVTVCPGQTTTLTASPSITGASGLQFAYQWRKGTQILSEGGKYTGTKTATLSINGASAAEAGTDYNVVVTTTTGTVSTTSANATVTLKKATTVTDPMSIAVCQDKPAQLAVTADGEGTLNKWIKDGVDVAGATLATLDFAAIKVTEGGKYVASVTGECGEILSKEAVVNVKTAPFVYGPSEKKISVKKGGLIRFAVATVSDASTKYHWFHDGTSVSTDSSANQFYTKFDVQTTGDAGKYWCIVSNDCGSTSSDTTEVLVTTSTSGVEDGETNGIVLYDNQPNPFSDVTNLQFKLAQSTSVRLSITDIFGREVAVLVSGSMVGGTYSIPFNASEHNITAGVYYYSLNAGGVSISKKMMFIK
ncbi:MAG: hypothetical protein HYZ54_10550 [Ignavibacteriae bacterium]|nr:hypothetical protein [Ignavibacteriota bacterium]